MHIKCIILHFRNATETEGGTEHQNMHIFVLGSGGKLKVSQELNGKFREVALVWFGF